MPSLVSLYTLFLFAATFAHGRAIPFRPARDITTTVTVTATPSGTSSAVSSAAVTSSTATQAMSSTPATSTFPTSSLVPAASTLVSASSMPSSSSSQTSSAASPSGSIPATSNPKFIVAHHMVGNTYPYTKQDWTDDITLAHASGIDGFALNVGSDDWQKTQVASAYEAAQDSGLPFKLFLSLDMTVLPCGSDADAQAIRSWVSQYTSHPNQFIYGDRAFVSTFSGETCTFGAGSTAEGWHSQFVGHPDLADKLFFVPSFFIDPATFPTFQDVMHGDFNWNGGWPIELTVDTLNNERTAAKVAADSAEDAITKFIGSTDTDLKHIDGLASLRTAKTKRDGSSDKLAYMASVSPWFFTHYGADSFNKNFVYLGDQHLYARRWESLIAARDKVDIVEINTWNDYGESHYIGPIKGAQPNSEAWTDGMNHTAWLDLTKYYATAFKEGAFPSIDTDTIVMWARPHAVDAQAQNDPVGQPTNFKLFEDTVWAVVMAKSPATVTLRTSDSNSQTFDVPAGVSKLSIGISAGETMYGSIERDGKMITELKPEGYALEGSPKTYNFNAFVASASA